MHSLDDFEMECNVAKIGQMQFHAGAANALGMHAPGKFLVLFLTYNLMS